MLLILLFVLFGPLSIKDYKTTSTTDTRMNILDEVGNTFYSNQSNKLKKNFFQECKNSNILPNGISLTFNLALGVNAYELVGRIQTILDQASSNILEALKDFSEVKEEETNDKLEELKKVAIENVGKRNFEREYVAIQRDKWSAIDQLRQNFKQKLKQLKNNQIIGPENFIYSKGSRKICAKKFIKTVGCNCSLDCPPPLTGETELATLTDRGRDTGR